jgi:hypothetical protein
MSQPITLPAYDADEGLEPIRNALWEQLLGEPADKPFRFSAEQDDGGLGAPAWTDSDGTVHVAQKVASYIPADREATLALAHQLVHSIGSGPGFLALEEQLLEEAIAELLAQLYLSPITEAFGGEAFEPDYLFRPLDEGNDLELERPTAAAVSVERFARLAVWLEQLDDQALDADDIEGAALKWAIRMKMVPAAERFEVLGLSAAAIEDGPEVDPDELQAAGMFMAAHFRRYMGQLKRSSSGFAAFDVASAAAWGDDRPAFSPTPASSSSEAWRQPLVDAQAVILQPSANDKQIAQALDLVGGHLEAPVRRSLDARGLLWGARVKHIAELGSLGVRPITDQPQAAPKPRSSE